MEKSLSTSFDALWAILMELGQGASCEIYCVIDALDECESESQQTLLDQIYRYFQIECARSSSRAHFLIISRIYPEISEYLLQFNHKDLSSYRAVSEDLETMIREKFKDLAGKKNYPEKGEGTFLWARIACGESMKVQSRNTVKILQELPRGLYILY